MAKPNLMNGRAYRLLVARWPGEVIGRIRARRAGSHLGLRDAIASLVLDVRAGRLR